MQQVWDKNGNVYFVDEQGQKVNNSLGNWQKAINKGRAAVTNIENWINEANPNSDAYKQKVSLISALTTAPAGMGSFATNALAKGFTPFMGRKITQAAAQGFGGGLVGGAVEGGVDSALNGENIALGALKGAAIGAPSGLAGGYAIGKLGQGIVRTGLKNGTTNKEQYFNDYVADLNNKTKAMADFRLAQTGGNKGGVYGLDDIIDTPKSTANFNPQKKLKDEMKDFININDDYFAVSFEDKTKSNWKGVSEKGNLKKSKSRYYPQTYRGEKFDIRVSDHNRALRGSGQWSDGNYTVIDFNGTPIKFDNDFIDGYNLDADIVVNKIGDFTKNKKDIAKFINDKVTNTYKLWNLKYPKLYF